MPSVQAMLLNSGCANACTGDAGLADAWTMSRDTDRWLEQVGLLKTKANTMVMSTGVIGQPLPMDRIRAGVETLASQLKASIGHTNTTDTTDTTHTTTANKTTTMSQDLHQSWQQCAQAFMTTDTFPKLRCREWTLPRSGHTVRMAGISKGAGMIHPNMATMLGLIVTDAKLPSAQWLQECTKYATERSFNAITVDGDTSTNDTLLVMANGQSVPQGEPPLSGDDLLAFRDRLTSFAQELAQLIVRDGEGATKFVTVHVEVGLRQVYVSVVIQGSLPLPHTFPTSISPFPSSAPPRTV